MVDYSFVCCMVCCSGFCLYFLINNRSSCAFFFRFLSVKEINSDAQFVPQDKTKPQKNFVSNSSVWHPTDKNLVSCYKKNLATLILTWLKQALNLECYSFAKVLPYRSLLVGLPVSCFIDKLSRKRNWV